MDHRVELIKAFYGGLPMDRAKVETSRYGFPFLATLLAGGAALEYGELTLSGALHKYKLTGITPARMDGLLAEHVAKACNVCLYFDARANTTFCFNLDNNHKTDNTVSIPEVELAVRALAARLDALGCPPLVVASGRGYHAWCRLDAPVANATLHAFMLHAAAVAQLALHERGLDRRRVKFSFYPDPRVIDVVSLRLFGSEHAKNRVFSRVLADDALLDEAASWAHFEAHLGTKTIAARTFEAALAAVQVAP